MKNFENFNKFQAKIQIVLFLIKPQILAAKS